MSLLASCKSQLMTRDRDLYVDRDSGAAARRGGRVRGLQGGSLPPWAHPRTPHVDLSLKFRKDPDC